MRFNEFANPTKTPEQLRIDSLKLAKDKAAKSLAAERQRQQIAKAQQRLNAVKQIKPNSTTSF